MVRPVPVEVSGPHSTQAWRALADAVEKLSLAQSLEAVIAVVRESARRISGADGVTFVLSDDGRCYYVEENAIGPLWKGQRFPLSACISGWCMLHGETAAIPDIYEDARIPHDAYRPTFVKSLVMVPVGKEHPLAAIGSYWATRRDFKAEEIALLEALARSTATALGAIAARNAVLENEEGLRLALSAGRLGAWELNLITRNLTASALCKAQFGRAPEELFSLDALQAMIHPEDRPAQQRAFGLAETTACDLDIEYRIVLAAGEERWIAMRGRPVLDANGKPERLAGVCLDTTEEKKSKERLDRLQSELAQFARVNELGQMVSALAHELNQPLTAANNYLSAARRFVEREDHSAQLSQALEKASSQFLRASEVIRRIRGFVGKAESTSAAEDLAPLTAEAVELALVDPRHRHIDIRIAIDQDLPRAMVDRVQYQQVLLNLLRNACEAMIDSPRREITISARKAEEPGMIEVRVADTGPGLAPAIAARLFEPFVTSKQSGMGVGLSICRNIIRSHGGELESVGERGAGAVFRLTLPIAQ